MLAFVVFVLAFFVTYFATPIVARLAQRAGFVGRDVHKPGRPKVPELGGLAIAAGIIVALLFTIASNSFATLEKIFGGNLNVIYLLAALSVILMVELVGFVDDVLGMRQRYKFLLPFLIALPLMTVKVSALHPFYIPVLNISIYNPWLYELILIPIGVCAATNLTNTFAGYNGLEAGLGAIAALFLLAIGWALGNNYIIILSTMLLGALLAFLNFNWYPARIFPNDVGNLLIGAMIATIVIIGGIEVAGVILLAPHIIDFVFFKIPNKLPKSVELFEKVGKIKEGKLYCKKPFDLAQLIMKISNGISERALVLTFFAIEIVFGTVVLWIYLT